MATTSDQSSEGEGRSANSEKDASSNPREIRLAKVSVNRTGHGVVMDILAGKLRLRLYIDAQWSDLVQTIAAGEGELDQLVPFRMVPLQLEADTNQVRPETLGARPIPELSSEHPLFGTPLWDAIFPSGEPPAPELGLDFDLDASSDEETGPNST